MRDGAAEKRNRSEQTLNIEEDANFVATVSGSLWRSKGYFCIFGVFGGKL